MAGRRVVIVGGGVGGLAAAVRLGAAGFGVTLVEKNPRVGGKLNLWEVPHPQRGGERPFRFDTGPSLLTLPFVFEELFAAAGERLADHLKLLRLDPISRFVWADGATFELRGDSDALEAELARFSPEDVAGWRAFAERGKRVWDLTADLFLQHAPEQAFRAAPGDGGRLKRLRAAAAMLSVPLRIGMFRRYGNVVDAAVRSRRLREVLYQYATYSGASPFQAPATLAVIPHAELHFGGWYPQGGMYGLAEALAGLAIRNGVTIRTDAVVEQIVIDGSSQRTVKGVQLEGGEFAAAEVVVANSDLIYSYRELVAPEHRPVYSDAKLGAMDPGGSGMAVMLGVEGTYPQLAHHTKFMPADYRSDLEAMFDTHRVPGDPCIYVCAASRTDDSVAPPGCENLFVLVSAPALDGSIDWEREGPAYADRLIATLEQRFGLEDLSRRIVVRRIISPADLRHLYNANAGSIYGLGSNSRRAAFLRPPNRDRTVRGLYFAGGATHPGGGLPLVALSGKIVSELVRDDFQP